MAEIVLDSKAFKHNINVIAMCVASNMYITHTNNAKHLSTPLRTPKSYKYLIDNAKLSKKAFISEKIALVLKDNAYGHGLIEIATLAKKCNIKNVFVKSYAEALIIKDLFSQITFFYGEIPHKKIPSNINCTISSLEQLKAFRGECGVELKVNVGMNRNGLEEDELDIALGIIKKRKIKLVGVFCHNGYGDNDNGVFNAQRERFSHIKHSVLQYCLANNLPTPRFHSLSTSGALRAKNIDDDLVRIGIGVYGYHTSELDLDIKLYPVASLFAHKIASRYLKKGERIGYGGVGVVEKAGVFSTYDVGYGDGLFRLSGKEISTSNDKNINKPHRQRLYCASGEEILPIVSMDCFSCQSNKDKICVFNDVSQMAKVFNTIPYVILSHLSPFLKRIIV